MTITIDSSGESMVLRTRAGIDLRFVLDLEGVELDGYTVAANLYSGGEDDPIALDSEIDTDESTITVSIPHTLTSTLPALCRYSISIIDEDEVVTGLFYGPVHVNQEFPA